MRALALTLAIGLSACGGVGALDAGPTHDAGARDGGAFDAGGARDAGSPRDAGPTRDGGVDAGVASDAGDSADAGSTDAGSSDAATPADAGPGMDAATCDPSALSFTPPGGSLAVGQLCDDVFVCATGSAQVAAVEGASPDFECQSTPEGPCSGTTCVLRPSVIDAAELESICKVTVLSPAPEMHCYVYL